MSPRLIVTESPVLPNRTAGLFVCAILHTSMLYLTKLSEPASEPLTVAQLAAHLRLNDDAENDLLQNWITAARQDFELRTQRQLVACSWKLGVECWANPIYLPRGPVSSIGSVKFYDADNVLTTVDAANYFLDNSRDMGMVRFYGSFVRPTVSADRVPIEVSFTAGFSTIPKLIVQGLTLLAAEMYRNREALTDKQLIELPYGYQSIVNLYKLNFDARLNDD